MGQIKEWKSVCIQPIRILLGPCRGVLLSLTWPVATIAHGNGFLTFPPFGWRAVASDWIASSSCIFSVSTYEGKYSALLLTIHISILHRGAAQIPISHSPPFPSSQAASAEEVFHDYIFSIDRYRYIFCTSIFAPLPAQGCWTSPPRVHTGRERQQWQVAAAQQCSVGNVVYLWLTLE